ncbi:MAG: hypothetical protein J5629_07900 [Muribaculaceae bacterium]|nr:hypothetical protein [Muribaculaceae bacterium]
MKYLTTHSIAIVVALVFASYMAITAQTLAGVYDDSTEYFDSKKHNKWRNSPNFKNALSILNDVDEDEDINYEEAIAMLENEIKQHPANGYALCDAAVASVNNDAVKMSMLVIELLYGNSGLSMDEADAVFQKRREETRQVALEAVDLLKRGVAQMPAADKENRCKAFIALGNLLHDEIEDNNGALDAYEQAATILPCYQSYEKLMKFYIEQGDNNKAIYYASKLGNLIDNDNETLGYLAQMYLDKSDYDTATMLVNKAIANDDSNKVAYQQLFTILMSQRRYQEALDKLIEKHDLFSVTDFVQNLAAIYGIEDNNKVMVLDKLHQLETAAISSDDEDVKKEAALWSYNEGLLHYIENDYRNALSCFDKVIELMPSATLLSFKANCHYMLGDAPQALKILNCAMRMPLEEEEGIQEKLLSQKIRIEMMCGMTDKQIYDSQVYCKVFPEESILGFEGLVRGYFNKGQYAKALEVCDEWAELYDKAIEPRYMHAYVLKLWGKDDQAREEMQDIINDENCNKERKMFALFYMGETEKSKTLLDGMARDAENPPLIAKTENAKAMPPEETSFYNLACAYSLHGDIDRALHFLERHYAEEESATGFDYAILDDELNNARKDPRFMEIVNRYKQQWLNGELNFRK